MNGRNGITERERWERIDAEAARLDALHDIHQEGLVGFTVPKPSQSEWKGACALVKSNWKKINGVWRNTKSKVKSWRWEPLTPVKFKRKHVPRNGPFPIPKKKTYTPFGKTKDGQVGMVVSTTHSCQNIGKVTEAQIHDYFDEPYGP